MRLKRGKSYGDIVAHDDRHRCESQIVFTLETLDYLARGGRIGRASAWAGQLLKVKPILTIRGGEVVPLKRVRGNRRAFQEFIASFEAGWGARPELRSGMVRAAVPGRAVGVGERV